MFRFFRTIRLRLLGENKISKYLLYALGEIILVVIGILIALRINNWNENRKLYQEEKATIASLKLEFKKNLGALKKANWPISSWFLATLWKISRP